MPKCHTLHIVISDSVLSILEQPTGNVLAAVLVTLLLILLQFQYLLYITQSDKLYEKHLFCQQLAC